MKIKLVAGLFLVGNVLAVPTMASVTFTDNTFNLSDYYKYPFTPEPCSAPTGGNCVYEVPVGYLFVEIAQKPNSGPDGSSALEITRMAADGWGPSRNYFLNNAFVYDPAVSGAIHSINFSQDHLWDSFGSTLDVGENAYSDGLLSGANVLILQNDKYYEYTGSLYSKGVWQTGQGNGITARQFSLITDLNQFNLDPSQHPDFTKGALQFGMYDGWNLFFVAQRGAAVQRSTWDNVSITVNSLAPVPLPAGVWLFGSGLLGISRLKRKVELMPTKSKG
jgi:hypothetical protein